MDDIQTLAKILLAALAIVYVIKWRSDPFRSIPTVGGPSAPLLSYISAYRFLYNAKEILAEGYQKYNGSVFKVAQLDQWMVVVSGSEIIEDIRKRPDSEATFMDGAEEGFKTEHTIGRDWIDDPYHIDIFRAKLMRALPAILPDVLEELMLAIPRFIPVTEEWTTVPAFPAMQKIVAQATNRVFVGVPTCRDPEYLDLAIQFGQAILIDRQFLKEFPVVLKRIVGRWLSTARDVYIKASPHLKPIVEDRIAKMQELGEKWTDKPNDLVQWIIEVAIPKNKSVDKMVERLLLAEFAAITTSSNSVTHALYHLATETEYIKPLRDEVDPIVSAEGWTRASIGKMWKLDSFMRESQRLNGVNTLSLHRKILKDITLSDGTFIPKGTLIAAASDAMHLDDEVYADARTFDPFRFARMHEAEGDAEGTKYQYASTSPDYLAFGHGRHGCPGRYFATNELKALIAYLVINYDFKLTDPAAGRPQNRYWAEHVLPNPAGKLLFRKRRPEAMSAKQ